MAFRKENISVEGEGAYVTVFQRLGEDPQLDINFFEGNRSIKQAVARQRALTKAIKLAKEWRGEHKCTNNSVPVDDVSI